MTLLYTAPSVTSVTSYLAWLNTLTGGLFWTMAVVSFFIIVFVSLSVYNFKTAVMTSCFLSLIMAILLRLGNLVGDWLVVAFIIGMAVSALWAYFETRS